MGKPPSLSLGLLRILEDARAWASAFLLNGLITILSFCSFIYPILRVEPGASYLLGSTTGLDFPSLLLFSCKEKRAPTLSAFSHVPLSWEYKRSGKVGSERVLKALGSPWANEYLYQCGWG